MVYHMGFVLLNACYSRNWIPAGNVTCFDHAQPNRRTACYTYAYLSNLDGEIISANLSTRQHSCRPRVSPRRFILGTDSAIQNHLPPQPFPPPKKKKSARMLHAICAVNQSFAIWKKNNIDNIAGQRWNTSTYNFTLKQLKST